MKYTEMKRSLNNAVTGTIHANLIAAGIFGEAFSETDAVMTTILNEDGKLITSKELKKRIKEEYNGAFSTSKISEYAIAGRVWRVGADGTCTKTGSRFPASFSHYVTVAKAVKTAAELDTFWAVPENVAAFYSMSNGKLREFLSAKGYYETRATAANGEAVEATAEDSTAVTIDNAAVAAAIAALVRNVDVRFMGELEIVSKAAGCFESFEAARKAVKAEAEAAKRAAAEAAAAEAAKKASVIADYEATCNAAEAAAAEAEAARAEAEAANAEATEAAAEATKAKGKAKALLTKVANALINEARNKAEAAAAAAEAEAAAYEAVNAGLASYLEAAA